MNKNNKKGIQNIFIIRNIIAILITIIILIFAFCKNTTFIKLILLPFLICSLAKLGENIFFLCGKDSIAIRCQYIFRISFFLYIYGFLIYTDYYGIIRKNYSLIVFSIPFWFFTIPFFKTSFFQKKKQFERYFIIKRKTFSYIKKQKTIFSFLLFVL